MFNKRMSSIARVYSFFCLVFRVIDLGVMTPCEKILETAIKENAGKFL